MGAAGWVEDVVNEIVDDTAAFPIDVVVVLSSQFDVVVSVCAEDSWICAIVVTKAGREAVDRGVTDFCVTELYRSGNPGDSFVCSADSVVVRHIDVLDDVAASADADSA